MARKRLGDLLIETGLISEEQLNHTLNTKAPEEKLGDALLREGYLTEQQLIEVLEFQLGIPHININQYPIDPDVIQLVPKELAKRHYAMPIRKDKNKLLVAMADPMDYFAIEEIRMATGYHIEPAIATKDALYRSITKFYDLQESMEEIMGELTPEESLEDEQVLRDDSPVVRLVNQIIVNGLAQRASDIHFDPQENDFRVRYRIDGILHTDRSLPKHMQNVIIARIKIMANLNITESRLPQDGRIKTTLDFKPVDIRVSTLPTVFGEKVVMRLLDLSSAMNRIEKIGFSTDNMETFLNMLKKPNGIILITGPTGSGKSSTLYAALNQLNSEDVNIITVEDPVEYQLDGINQIQVKEEIGLTFANGLRSILRQDPDIVMIGEIRDTETAEVATRASLTGHLVLSTLHTNSAIEALSRLRDMGIEPFLISSSIVGIVAQRLVRRVCRDCGREVPANEREKEIFASRGLAIETLFRGEGCGSCNNTGYRGRIAIHEVLTINEEIRQLILRKSSTADIRNLARQGGIKFLVDDGLLKVKEGLTTTEEVLRVTVLD
jgi:type IV pilus assembly protein PilB